MIPAQAPFFAYRGGKAMLRKYIIRWCPLEGSIYCEPFAGRANVFFLMRVLGSFSKWHLNDLQTIPFFKAILEYDGSQIHSLNSQEYEILKTQNPTLHQLLSPIYSWAGGGGASTGHSRAQSLTRYRGHLLRAQKLLHGTELSAVDANLVLQKYAGDSKAFLYIDPPYQNGNVGVYGPEAHFRKETIRILKEARCRWILSEYPCSDLKEAFGNPFTIIENVSVNPNPKSKKTRRHVSECLWSNFKIGAPNEIDFKYVEKPMAVSLQTLDSLGGQTDFETWKNATPKHWSPQTDLMQFSRLAMWPHCYYNGRIVAYVNQWEGGTIKISK